ncbi:MAG: hypothetical protein MJ095_06675 [Oscillospiraceae bacterium]|nr:hypothetical protein [Oscillospiraceae bacterium]
MSMDMLKKSAENRKKLIPADFDSRIDSLLASLPDEVPVSESTEAEVIKRTRHFNIRPLVSAAAVFALALTGIWAAGSGAHRTFGRGQGNDKKYVTTSEACETTSVTSAEAETSASETEEVTSEVTSAGTENESVAFSEAVKQNSSDEHGSSHDSSPEAVPSDEVQKPVPGNPNEHEKVTAPAQPERPGHPDHPAAPSSPEAPSRPDEPLKPEELTPPAAPEHPEHPVQGNEKEPGKPEHPEVPVQVHPEHPLNKTDRDENKKNINAQEEAVPYNAGNTMMPAPHDNEAGKAHEPEHVHPDKEQKK